METPEFSEFDADFDTEPPDDTVDLDTHAEVVLDAEPDDDLSDAEALPDGEAEVDLPLEEAPTGFDYVDHEPLAGEDLREAEPPQGDPDVTAVSDVEFTGGGDGLGGDVDRAGEPSETDPAGVEVGPLPEPVDGFPWADPALLEVELGPEPPAAEVSAVEPERLLADLRLDAAGGDEGRGDWERLATDEDPAVRHLAQFWRPAS